MLPTLKQPCWWVLIYFQYLFPQKLMMLPTFSLVRDVTYFEVAMLGESQRQSGTFFGENVDHDDVAVFWINSRITQLTHQVRGAEEAYTAAPEIVNEVGRKREHPLPKDQTALPNLLKIWCEDISWGNNSWGTEGFFEKKKNNDFLKLFFYPSNKLFLSLQRTVFFFQKVKIFSKKLNFFQKVKIFSKKLKFKNPLCTTYHISCPKKTFQRPIKSPIKSSTRLLKSLTFGYSTTRQITFDELFMGQKNVYLGYPIFPQSIYTPKLSKIGQAVRSVGVLLFLSHLILGASVLYSLIYQKKKTNQK